MSNFNFIKALNSPFKPFKIKAYIGKTKIGVPYFLPRKWVPMKDKPGYLTSVPKKIGFDYCDLGFKTKWSDTDYRFEWSPTLSFVFFGYQLALMVTTDNPDKYWEAWLYYQNNTDKTKSQRERIEQCKKEFPLTYSVYKQGQEKETIDYYRLILKKKYIGLTVEENRDNRLKEIL